MNLLYQSYETTYRAIAGRAWPIVLANTSTPLLGLAEATVIGRPGEVAALGAIALCSLVFNFVYWTFGFFQMVTTGLVAKASRLGVLYPWFRRSIGEMRPLTRKNYLSYFVRNVSLVISERIRSWKPFPFSRFWWTMVSISFRSAKLGTRPVA